MQIKEVDEIKVKKGSFKSLWLAKIWYGDRFYVIDPDYRILKDGLWYKFKKRNLYVNGFWDASKEDKTYPIDFRLRLCDGKDSRNIVDPHIFDSFYTEKNSGFRIGALIGTYKYTTNVNSTGIINSTNLLLNHTRNGEVVQPRIYIEGKDPSVKSDKWFNYLDGYPFTVPYLQAQDTVLFTYNGGDSTVPVTVSNGTQDLAFNTSSKSSIEDYDIVDSIPVNWLTIKKLGKAVNIVCKSNSSDLDRSHSIVLVHKDYKWLKRTVNIKQVANPNVGLQNFDTFIIETTPSSLSTGSCEIDTQVIIKNSGLQGYINGSSNRVPIDGVKVGWSKNYTISLKPSTRKFEDAITYSLDSTSSGKVEQVIFNLVNLDTPESHDLLSNITTISILVNWWSNGRTPAEYKWDMDLGIYTYKNGLPPKSVPSAGSVGQVVLADTKQLVDNLSMSGLWVQGVATTGSGDDNTNHYFEIATITYNKNTKTANIEIHTPSKNG